VMLALLFMLKVRIHHKESYSLLSCSDIEKLLAGLLPRREGEDELIRQLDIRHRKRQASIDYANRKQQADLLL